MSKPKTLAAYPEVYLGILEQVLETGEYNSPPISRKEAETIRLDFYGLRRAAFHERHPCAREWQQISFRILPHNEELVVLNARKVSIVAASLAETLEKKYHVMASDQPKP